MMQLRTTTNTLTGPVARALIGAGLFGPTPRRSRTT